MTRIIAIVLLLITAAISVFWFVNKENTTKESQPLVEILEDKIVLDTSLVHTSNPERYQPSYNLRGKLAPMRTVTVNSIFKSAEVEYLVEKGDWVDEGQPIARLIIQTDKPVRNTEWVEVVSATNKSQPFAADDPTNDSDANTDTDTGTETDIDINEDGTPNDLRQQKDDTRTSAKDDEAVEDARKSDMNKNNLPDSETSTDSNTVESAKNNKENELDEVANTKNALIDSQTNLESKALGDKLSSEQVNASNDEELNDESETKIANAPTYTTTDSEATLPTRHIITELIVKSPLDGEVMARYDDSTFDINKGMQPLFKVANTRELQLIGRLPLETEPNLSVGQTVNFKVLEAHKEFTGQIGYIIPKIDQDELIVEAPVIPSSENKAILEHGMHATMVIDYGGLELAVRLPQSAIHDVDLTGLTNKYPRPVSPLHGYVWVIDHDEQINLTPIEVVQYFPDSAQYLVHGISNDSLIVLTDLPKAMDGKRVVLR